MKLKCYRSATSSDFSRRISGKVNNFFQWSFKLCVLKLLLYKIKNYNHQPNLSEIITYRRKIKGNKEIIDGDIKLG